LYKITAWRATFGTRGWAKKTGEWKALEDRRHQGEQSLRRRSIKKTKERELKRIGLEPEGHHQGIYKSHLQCPTKPVVGRMAA